MGKIKLKWGRLNMELLWGNIKVGYVEWGDSC